MERIRKQGTREVIADNPDERIAAIRKVVEEKQYAKIDGDMADLFTASLVCSMYDALNNENKVKFADCKWPIMARIALSIIDD